MESRYLLGRALENWADRARGRLTAIFCESVRDAHETAEEWNQAGFRAMAVSGASSRHERRDAIAAARAGAIDALVCADLYIAGLDIAEIGCVICLRRSDSLVIWLQMVGRGLRKSTIWPNCLLFDHAGNCRRPGLGHPLERRMHLWSLDGQPGPGRGGRRNPWNNVLPAQVCERCYSCDVVGGRCQECGHQRELVLPPRTRIVDGQLVRVSPEEVRREREEASRQRWQEERQCQTLADWVALGQARGYRHPEGWARTRWGLRQRRR